MIYCCIRLVCWTKKHLGGLHCPSPDGFEMLTIALEQRSLNWSTLLLDQWIEWNKFMSQSWSKDNQMTYILPKISKKVQIATIINESVLTADYQISHPLKRQLTILIPELISSCLEVIHRIPLDSRPKSWVMPRENKFAKQPKPCNLNKANFSSRKRSIRPVREHCHFQVLWIG